jgi:signal transduction histidine kinase
MPWKTRPTCPSRESYLDEAIKLYDQLHDTLSILNGITAMSDYYLASGQADKGIIACRRGIEIVERGFSFPLSELYWTLAQCYKKAGDNGKYAETLNTIINLNNANYKKNSEEALAELNAKYELRNKEAFIATQKLELLRKNIWIGIVALITLLIAICAYFFFRRYRRRQIIALTVAEEKERRRIAADLHDNIGAYASAISADIDEIESRKLIPASSIINLKNNATEIISALRDTIWAFNKESITLTGISDRVKIFVQKIQPSYPSINIRIEENITREMDLSPVRALHIFRIIQEAMNNAVKHSKCDTLLIDISSDNESAKISIEDNGNGFDPVSMKNSGNGLMNMKNRATEASFNLTLSSTSPKGTKILLVSVIHK